MAIDARLPQASRTAPTGASTRGTFADARRAVEGIDGWLTDDQARRLWSAARRLSPGARIVEIGSFRGRSAIVTAMGASAGVEIAAIDPHAGSDRGPQELDAEPERGADDHARFLANLEAAGVSDRVHHVRKFSRDALADVDGPIDLLYIDGTHRYAPALDDIREWGARVTPGGTVLLHDAFCSIGVTGAILRELAFGRDSRYVGRSGSMAEYRREPVRGWSRVSNALRQLAQLPWFLRSLLVKLLIVAHLRPVTRLLGNTLEWPY